MCVDIYTVYMKGVWIYIYSIYERCAAGWQGVFVLVWTSRRCLLFDLPQTLVHMYFPLGFQASKIFFFHAFVNFIQNLQITGRAVGSYLRMRTGLFYFSFI